MGFRNGFAPLPRPRLLPRTRKVPAEGSRLTGGPGQPVYVRAQRPGELHRPVRRSGQLRRLSGGERRHLSLNRIRFRLAGRQGILLFRQGRPRGRGVVSRVSRHRPEGRPPLKARQTALRVRGQRLGQHPFRRDKVGLPQGPDAAGSVASLF